ncbi:hypothetical protein BJ973_006332 [Actinoplanes tereljensis]|uniref:DUF397 domain-containing protein n=1 Tax=Paractinoplanes tereljensis TaxID=571912 RepID=A0A919NKE4_9ACTN|nr:DUF397 domain-containing protein [Actinoplanes tereljensis]GIF19287.1 hypothetical protein Ate02nite_20170 [Actinoplanes tereljensis]
MEDLSGAVWRKSIRSDNGGASCVEVAANLPGIVGVRDSKDRSGPVLTFAPPVWAAFVEGLKGGEFDLPG